MFASLHPCHKKMFFICGIPMTMSDMNYYVWRESGRYVALERVSLPSVFYLYKEIGQCDTQVITAYISKRDARRVMRLYANVKNVNTWRQITANETEMGMSFDSFSNGI